MTQNHNHQQPSSASTSPPSTRPAGASWRNKGSKDTPHQGLARTVEQPATVAAATLRGPAPATAPTLHPVTSDGRVRHYYTSVAGHWLCACGDTRPIGGTAA